jgi:hypothetical protein
MKGATWNDSRNKSLISMEEKTVIGAARDLVIELCEALECHRRKDAWPWAEFAKNGKVICECLSCSQVKRVKRLLAAGFLSEQGHATEARTK